MRLGHNIAPPNIECTGSEHSTKATIAMGLTEKGAQSQECAIHKLRDHEDIGDQSIWLEKNLYNETKWRRTQNQNGALHVGR